MCRIFLGHEVEHLQISRQHPHPAARVTLPSPPCLFIDTIACASTQISTMSSGAGSVRRQASAAPGPKPPCSIHPSAIISDKAVIVGTHPVSIGENVVLHPFAKIVSNTGAVRIGKNCVVGDRATVGLSDSPGAFAGTTVELEEGVSVESGSIVQAEKIGTGSTVEANSTLGPGVVVGKVSDQSILTNMSVPFVC